MKFRTRAGLLGTSIFLSLQATQGAEIPKLFNNVALNLPGAWSGGVVPGPGDVALWNELFASTVTSTAALSPLGADLSFGGIKVTAVGGTRNVASNYVGFFSPNPSKTLTLGAAGIDLSTATQAFYGAAKITIGADQTWNIGNANTIGSPAGSNNNEDLNLIAQALGDPFNFGGNKVTTTGAGQVTLSSGYTLSNGTLDVGNNLFVIQGGSSRTTTLRADLNLVVSAGTLRLQSNSGFNNVSIVSAAPITVNAGTLVFQSSSLPIVQSGPITTNAGSAFQVTTTGGSAISFTGSITANGAVTYRSTGSSTAADAQKIQGNLLGAGTITYQNTATGTNNQLNLSGDNSGFTGSFDINGGSNNRSLRMSTATAGSASAIWTVSALNTLQVNGVSVQLGTLKGDGSITNSSATAAATLNVGAGNFTGIISDGALQRTNLNKVGPGVLSLSGPNTYSGLTSVTAGKLVLPTTQVPANPADFTIADGATLAVLQSAADTTLATNQISVGTVAGGTLEVDLGTQTNPSFAPLSVENLLLNGSSILRVSGTNISLGSFPLVQYTAVGGSGGVAGLTLKLPARTVGTLTNSAGALGVDITETQQVKWVGNVSNDWDIDPDGTGTLGTPNWKTTVTNTATRYLQGSAGTDIVNFDDTATGSGTVVLTTTLAPLGLKISNSAKDYTFTGPGKLTGTTSLVKSGTGTLTLANTGTNDYIGGTTIDAGVLRLGDGVTVGGGIISGPIANNGRLVLDRPADFTFANPLTGTGILEKAGGNIVTIVNPAIANPIVLTAGKLLLTGGGNLSGAISGPGQLETTSGQLFIDGTDTNSNTGLTTISGGSLRLQKPAGTTAIGGDITITGGGNLAILADEQIADTATLNVFGTSTDSLIGTTGKETLANANVNGVSGATQLILRNNAEITGTATVTQGILGVASGSTASVNTILLTSPTALMRIAGSGGPSVFNVGAGGITASAGEIQVKFNAADQDATLNLAGGLTTTGDFTITNAGYTGANLNVINLPAGAHAFDIAAATTTTIAPDFGGDGSLVKSGTGTLKLNASCSAAYLGGTTVTAGSLIVNGSVSGPTGVAAGATIGGTGTLAGGTTVQGAISPGDGGIGTLTTTGGITLAAGSAYAFDISNWTGSTPGTDSDLLAAETLTLTASPTNKLVINVSGNPAGFTETAKTLVIATSANPIAGFDASAITVSSAGFTGTGTFTVQQTGNTVELVYAAGTASAYSTWAALNGLDASNNGPTQDPDNDGRQNFVEFALNGNPLSGAMPGKVSVQIATVGAEKALTLTIPVRSSAPFTGATEQTLSVDGLTYHIQGSDALDVWDLAVTEVTGADAVTIQTPLPALQDGWFYRTFRSPGPVAGDPADFLRARIDY